MHLVYTVAAPIILGASMASAAWCHDSVSCFVGGPDLCSTVCIRQGSPAGGACVDRTGCPGNSLCACKSGKRDDEVFDGDAAILEYLQLFEEFGNLEAVDETVADDDSEAEVETDGGDLEAREMEKRSICCSLPNPTGGLCCELHCAYIGKPGGQCSGNNVCTCN